MIFAIIITNQNGASLGGLEPPSFRLTAERANRLRYGDHCDSTCTCTSAKD